MKPKEDKLKKHRFSNEESRDSFYLWLNQNCTKATSHEKVRKTLDKIKKPLKDVVNE